MPVSSKKNHRINTNKYNIEFVFLLSLNIVHNVFIFWLHLIKIYVSNILEFVYSMTVFQYWN